MKAWRALAVAAALSACGPSPHPTPQPPLEATDDDAAEPERDLSAVPGRAPTPAEGRAMRRLMRMAESIRSLRFATPVPFRVQDRDVITAFVRDQIDAEELERARIFYVAIGLLAPDLAVDELIVRVLGEQIVGYYDPEQSLMVVREDVARELAGSRRGSQALGEAEMVIVHELVHALQDQRLGLGERYEEERSIDGDNAFAMLVEGDATLAMVGHMIGQQGQPLRALTRNTALLRMMIRDSPDAVRGQEMENAPPIIRIPLVSRYLDGLVFCASLHGRQGWNGVDGAYRTLPVSTEQVLHPERYAAEEAPDAITLPELPELAAAGLVPHEEDTLGELEMGIWFGLGSDTAERDESAAEGWGGDRLRVYRDASGADTAVVWFTTWDDEGEAQEAEAAARAVTDRLASTARAPAHVERRGRAVLVLLDLAPELKEAVRVAFDAFVSALPPSSASD
ncbi:MAG: hypothetical protein H6719_00465 [Sandaracinaceae bacterium]|nr:hypothetical protein [Sandaracinaceae bacterium]